MQWVFIAGMALLVAFGVYQGLRSYEERVGVQAVRLALEYRVADIDYERAGQARDMAMLWAVYAPQIDLSEADYYKMAGPIVDSHHTRQPLTAALLAGALVVILLGIAARVCGSNRIFLQLLEHKHRELENSQRKLAEASISDPETGLANKKYFARLLDIECRRAVREFNPLTLMLVEIDAATGAGGGDGLMPVAALLQDNIARPGDVVARYSAQGFALLLPATNEQSPQLAERLCERVRALRVSGQALSISIGVCTLQPSAQLTAQHILQVTSDALQQARQQGGDQVCSNAEKARDLPVTYSS